MRVKLLDSSTEEVVIQLPLECIPRAGEKFTYTFDESFIDKDEDDEPPAGDEHYDKMRAAQGRYLIEAVEHVVETVPGGMYGLKNKQTVLLFVTKLV